MAKSIATFLMFEGKAEEAMNFYVSLFEGSEVQAIERYGKEGPGAAGSVKKADFLLGGHPMMCIDSPIPHAFKFTPSTSLFVECADEAEFDNTFAKLSEAGQILMPPGNYGFSQKFTWLNDRFGVSWQLTLQ
ncbi:VOC family protein [Schlesneria sp.]|uniref:VOC family protein n=1 Tax=Schlesneria sp. TaxID=2762018 RepID=UPI002EEA7805